MFSRRRLHDKYVSWRKLFLQNWSLFKASRIGVVGLAIMIAFLIIALAVPYMGLRDPLYWLAPEQDTIQVARWWGAEVTSGSLLTGVNGSVYAMEDEVLNAACPIPLTRNLGSPITGLAALTVDFNAGTTERDGFVVGTEAGRLFAFTVNGTAGGFYRELWNVSLGSAPL